MGKLNNDSIWPILYYYIIGVTKGSDTVPKLLKEVGPNMLFKRCFRLAIKVYKAIKEEYRTHMVGIRQKEDL